MKHIVITFLLILSVLILELPLMSAAAEDSNYNSHAFVLMEASTGTILLDKNKDEQLAPASITKIMTLLLIFEALESNSIHMEDMVCVSEHAASMGGSQVYLEPGEQLSVNDMIKCISISSANDASVAMAEFISGSETAFVAKMNQKAEELGMKNTNFVNCYGLDTENHYSSALDVALMSRELITKHPEIFRYSTVWMDSILHVTAKGTSEFGLSNTNKLLKTYQGITGLKTGSTGQAKYCLSATANRNEMDIIAVIMAAPDTKTRFSEAAALLDYGFANCHLYQNNGDSIELPALPVKHGIEDTVSLGFEGIFSYVCTEDISASDITYEITLSEEAEAPVLKGDVLGSVTFKYLSDTLGTLNIVANEDCKKAGFGDSFKKCLNLFFCN